LQDSTFEL
jgi:hypothetical protein